MIGKIQRKSFLAVASYHASGRHLGKDGGCGPAVLFGQRHEGLVLF